MKEYKIVFSSSMKSKVRQKIKGVINNVNNTLDTLQIGVKFSVLAYGQTPIADQGKKTQDIINNYIAESDILILVADNGKKIGNATMKEYKAAHEQSKKSGNNLPHIKAFALLNKNGEDINILYDKEDGTEEPFETRLYNDSGRYMQCIEATKFKETLKNWLLGVAQSELNNCLTQKELDYGRHIGRIRQGWIRKNNDKYYRRDKLDGKIETILETSPIVILEGNTYSGKTRAAFELMKRNESWKDYNFHIYGGYHSIEALNRLRLDLRGGKNVYLFDDINAIIESGSINREESLWAKLNGYNINNGNTGFSLSDFGNTRIIITVAGSLSEEDRANLYCTIFNTKGSAFEESIKDIIVNFDITDRKEFIELVAAMKRSGILNSRDLRTGNNYTIGSLFIKEEDIRWLIREEFKKNATLLVSLVGYFKYAVRPGYTTGLTDEIEYLYNYISTGQIQSGNLVEPQRKFTKGLELLRSKGLLIIDYRNGEATISIDDYIINILSSEVIKNLRIKNDSEVFALHHILMGYATACMKLYKDAKNHFSCPRIRQSAEMGYRIIQNSTLPDKDKDNEILHLISIIESEYLGTHNIANIINRAKFIREKEAVTIASTIIEIVKNQDDYSMRFVASAIAGLYNFNLAYTIIRAYYAYYQHIHADSVLDLYKETVYTMLSGCKRSMTMYQERKILRLIFNDEEKWIEPFSDKDLEQNIVYLERIAPFITQKSAVDIIKLLPKTSIKGCNIEKFNKENINYKNSDSEYIKIDINIDNIDTRDLYYSQSLEYSLLEGYEEYNLYEKVYLKQVRDAIITALKRVNSFDEFEEVIDIINKMRDKSSKEYSVHIKRAIDSSFASQFYRAIPEIAERLQFNDRAKLFDFIFKISETDDKHRAKRIVCLNQLLKCLDENNALSGYKKMIDKNLYDSHSLSMLSNNSELGFESLFELNNNEHSNFITLNQLLGKAETLSDADSCLRLMGIKDGDPCKLKDENALIQYIRIKAINSYQCIDIIKKSKIKKFSDTFLNAFIEKLNKKQLIEIFFPSDQNSTPNYEENYGLSDDTINSVRENAKLINIGILRVNREEEHKDKIKQKYTDIIESDQLRYLIIDPDYNGGNCIIVEYMKNKYIFPNYEEVRKFWDEFKTRYKIKATEHIYDIFLWHINNGFNRSSYSRKDAINMTNTILIEAYNDFANNYPKREVIKMMAKLYHYRPLLIDNFEAKEDFVYEDQILKNLNYKDQILKNLNYKEYLQYIKEHNKDYVDGTFIYNSLLIMKKSIDEDIYKLLGEIAKANRVGVKYDTIFSSKSKLSAEIQNRLLSFDNDNNKLQINSDFIYNASQIKILLFLLKNGHIDIDSAEDYRKKAGLPITQTYLNMVFKYREQKIRNDNKRARYRIEIQEEGFNSLVSFLNEHITDDSTHLHRSIEMCISLIGVAPNEDTLNSIFKNGGFGGFKDKTEVLTARMNKIINLRYYKNIKEDENKTAFKTLNKFREVIINHCDKINIYTVNTYLKVYIMALKKELFVPKNEDIDYEAFENSWSQLKDERKIDMFKLLKVNEEEKSTIAERLKLGENENWIIDANVQTFSYFAKYDQQLISTMDKAFDGNFCYDGEKSCLKDAIKNYSYFYNNKDNNYPKEEVSNIAEILSRKENEKVLNEICDEYIIKSEKKYGLWKSIDFLWQDLLECSDFKKKAILYICRLAKEMLHYKGRHTPNFAKLDINDNDRISTLKECFSSNDLDSYTLEAIDSCLKEINDAVNNQDEQIRANAEKALNIFKSIFPSVINQQVS